MLRKVLVCTLFILWSFHAQAQTCDAASFLKMDQLAVSSDIRVTLLYLEQFFKNTNSTDKKSFNGQVFTPYGFGTMDYDDAHTFYENISHLLNINYSYAEKSSLSESHLDPGGVQAYADCLNSREDFSVTIPPGAADQSTFTVVVDSHPGHRTPETLKLTIHVTNGKIKNKNDKTDFDERIDAFQKGISFTISRDEPKKSATDVVVSIQEANRAQIISLPPLPAFKLISRPKLADSTFSDKSKSFSFRLSDTTTDVGPTYYCVDATDQEVIVPGTVHLHFTDGTPLTSEGVAGDCQTIKSGTCNDFKHKDDPQGKQSCAAVFGHLSAIRGLAQARGTAEATVATTVDSDVDLAQMFPLQLLQ